MLTHVHALNPFHLSISPAWELLNQHKNPTRPSSTCSTSIVQKPKRTRCYPSTVQPAFVLAGCSSHDETLLLQIELLKVKCQKFIAGYHKHQWAIDLALSWVGNNGRREGVKFFLQFPTGKFSDFILLYPAFQEFAATRIENQTETLSWVDNSVVFLRSFCKTSIKGLPHLSTICFRIERKLSRPSSKPESGP